MRPVAQRQTSRPAASLTTTSKRCAVGKVRTTGAWLPFVTVSVSVTGIQSGRPGLVNVAIGIHASYPPTGIRRPAYASANARATASAETARCCGSATLLGRSIAVGVAGSLASLRGRSTLVEKTTSRNAPTQKAAVPQGANLVEVSQGRPKMEGGWRSAA